MSREKRGSSLCDIESPDSAQKDKAYSIKCDEHVINVQQQISALSQATK